MTNRAAEVGLRAPTEFVFPGVTGLEGVRVFVPRTRPVRLCISIYHKSLHRVASYIRMFEIRLTCNRNLCTSTPSNINTKRAESSV